MKNNTEKAQTWHLIDAKNKILGRISTEIAGILAGKQKVYYMKNIDTGDFVVVINAKDVLLSGKKEMQKTYYRHSGYPGGLKSQTASLIRVKNPETLIRHAVAGMLPKSRLGKAMARKLFVYSDTKHPHQEKFKSN